MKILIFLLLSAITGQAAFAWTNIGTAWIQVPANSGAGPSIGPTIGDTITISAWIMRQLDQGTTRQVLIDRGNSQPSPGDFLYDVHILTNYFRFEFSHPVASVQIWQTTSAAPAVNVPAHVAVSYTYGTAASLKFYINGAIVSGSWIAGTGATNSGSNANSLMVGGDAFGNAFLGLITEVAIWNSILSDQEVMMLATSKIKRLPPMISPTTLVVYLPMDDHTTYFNGVDARVKDLSSNNRHGSIEGFGSLVCWPEPYLSYPPNE